LQGRFFGTAVKQMNLYHSRRRIEQGSEGHENAAKHQGLIVESGLIPSLAKIYIVSEGIE
jgi:hypothetical protein